MANPAKLEWTATDHRQTLAQPHDIGIRELLVASAQPDGSRSGEGQIMIGRIVWWAVLSCVALVTAGLQLDKQSEVTPALAPLVPAPLRNFAQTQITASAAENGDPAVALAESEDWCAAARFRPNTLQFWRSPLAKAGKLQNAALAIQFAGQRGWREAIAQEAVLRLALAAGDQAEAARR